MALGKYINQNGLAVGAARANNKGPDIAGGRQGNIRAVARAGQGTFEGGCRQGRQARHYYRGAGASKRRAWHIGRQGSECGIGGRMPVSGFSPVWGAVVRRRQRSRRKAPKALARATAARWRQPVVVAITRIDSQ